MIVINWFVSLGYRKKTETTTTIRLGSKDVRRDALRSGFVEWLTCILWRHSKLSFTAQTNGTTDSPRCCSANFQGNQDIGHPFQNPAHGGCVLAALLRLPVCCCCCSIHYSIAPAHSQLQPRVGETAAIDFYMASSGDVGSFLALLRSPCFWRKWMKYSTDGSSSSALDECTTYITMALALSYNIWVLFTVTVYIYFFFGSWLTI